MTDFDDLAHRYIAAWNERDADTRAKLVADLWAEDARYSDPLGVATGRDQISGTIAAVQGQFPDLVFRLAAPVDGHHDQLRFAWELGPADGDAPIAGFDVAVVNSDGQLDTVLGFLDRVPAA